MEHPADVFEKMTDAQLIAQADDVIAAALDHWEGDDSGLRQYGEIRAKYLLAEIRKRWPG